MDERCELGLEVPDGHHCNGMDCGHQKCCLGCARRDKECTDWCDCIEVEEEKRESMEEDRWQELDELRQERRERR
jgi:hypothetical protein